MKSLSSVGLGLSVIFGCLVLALVAELYYLLFWKKRVANRAIEERYSSSSPAKELLYMFCLKKPSPIVSQSALDPQEIYSSSVVDSENQVAVQVQSTASISNGNNKDSLMKSLDPQDTMEAELMRLHKIAGPPRFLFTIVEETKEDLLDSEDGKSRKGSRGRSLSDLLVAVETPYLTPIASPSLFTPPLTPIGGSYNPHSFNPLFESSTDAEFIRMTSASPPPRFKFLQDAEEKLRRKRMLDAEKSAVASQKPVKDEEDGSFITIVVDKKKGREEK